MTRSVLLDLILERHHSTPTELLFWLVIDSWHLIDRRQLIDVGMSVFEKLHTYPSRANSTLILPCYQLTVVGLGEG